MPKLENVKQSHGYNKSDNSDDEWIPSSHRSRRKNVSLNKKGSRQEFSPYEFGWEGWKENSCPVCRKSFSRIAALICHVRQNHSYMLSKRLGDKTDTHSLKREVMEWKTRKIREGKNAESDETSFATGSSGTDKDSGNEACTGSNIKSKNNDEGETNGVDDGYSIIGGSVDSIGDKCFQSTANSSILSFNSTNTDLLDPEQSFSIIRQNTKKNIKKSRRPPQKSTVSYSDGTASQKTSYSDSSASQKTSYSDSSASQKTSYSDSTASQKTSKNMASLDFALIDLSIDNSSEDQKTFECFVCKNRFSTSSLLTYHHMRKHMTNDFRQCLECGSVFYDLPSYTSHCNLHSKSTRVKRHIRP